jgi:uncharacterized protein
MSAKAKGGMTVGAMVKYLLIGVYFGIVLIKSEVVSWYRIQEMFRFQSIHMYGIIGLAAVVGVLTVMIIRVFRLRAPGGGPMNLEGKPFNRIGNFVGGAIFGFGWALTGACPGPLYALVGAGYWTVLVALLFAMLGALSYGYLRPKLPH